MHALSKYLEYLFLTFLILVGFAYRYIGISQNLSYWNDESVTALFTRGIAIRGFPSLENGNDLGVYQIALFYVTALSFAIFGETEIAGRLPSVLAGTALIPLMFFVTKRMIGQKEALIAASLTTFAQMQLAWSTQLRPYIWLEIFMILTMYWCYLCVIDKKRLLNSHILKAMAAAIASSLFHGTGMLCWIVIVGTIFYKSIYHKQYKPLLIAIPIIILTFSLALFSISARLINIIALIFWFHTEIHHYIVFFGKSYVWLITGSLIGSYALSFKKKEAAYLLIGTTAMIFILAIVKINPWYVRYSTPAFPLLYMLFAVGSVETYEYVRKHYKGLNKTLVAICIGIAFFASPLILQKIIIVPQDYYSINADIRENPIVDYKTAFAKIEDRIKNEKSVILMDAWVDRIPYYLPGQKFVWLVREEQWLADRDSEYDEIRVGTIKGFELQKRKYPSGIVIVENWMSMTPPELQDHIRNTLKHEFDEGTVTGNEDDPWSISIYSWGLEKE